MHRLHTHEDPFGVHKVLGVACLAHFAYRISLGGDMGLVPNRWTLASLVLHAALHVSSFQFALPGRRNFKYNIIFPEMRLHTMIFAYRALLCTYVSLFAPGLRRILNGLIVLGTMAAADAATWVYKSHGNGTTMRGNAYPEWLPKGYGTALNRFYSASQIMATMNMIHGTSHSMFLTVLPIQVAPFLMTLEKKGLIRQWHWHLWYTIAILINYYSGIVNTAKKRWLFRPMVAFVYYFRIHRGLNKYLLWFLVALTA